MKKIVFLLAMMILCCCACTKYCTCSVGTSSTSSSNMQEIEIGYNEDCADYSNSNLSCK